jgi:hypothetical protein
VNYGDPSGTDAIVLFMQKFPGGGGVFGDIGLIVQKGSDWSFFLWSSGGPIMIPLDAKDGKLVSTTFEELNQELYDKGMRIAGLSDWASAMFGSGSSSQSSKTGGRKSGYKSSVYLSGDYTATFAFCKDAYENGLEKTYSFLFNNCSQVALEALGQSNSTIDSKYGKLISTIPLVIYNFLVKYGTKNVLVK